MSLKFAAVLGYSEYLRFLSVVNSMPPASHFTLDLRDVHFAHPGGMGPLASTVHALKSGGWSFELILPKDAFLAHYFAKAGWLAGITGEPRPPKTKASSFFPLAQYSDHAQLNPLINRAVDHLASTAVYEPGVIDAIEWSLNEIADNVLLHAGPGVSGWLQMIAQPKKNLVEFVVVDSGRGITQSLRERFTDLKDDREAVMKAVEKGVTRDPAIGQGNGLAGTLRIAAAAKGWITIHSGHGLLRAMPGQPLYCNLGPQHQGTVVEVTLPTKTPIKVADALWGHEPVPQLEMRYAQEASGGVLVRLAEESTGFGNRASARPIRLKIRNLMVEFPDELVTIDFLAATLVSASFADELIARLANELGVDAFLSRVRLINLSDLARRTVDAVLTQRLGPKARSE